MQKKTSLKSQGEKEIKIKKAVQGEVYKLESTANEKQINNRTHLRELFENSPLSKDDLLFNLGLYVRSSLLVKFLVMNDVYERIKGLPGALMEFGVWYGQNLVLLENLRSIHEPFNKQRRIYGFDTFTGYKGASKKDKKSSFYKENSYDTEINYPEYLKKLLRTHEGSNVLGHIQDIHHLEVGDVSETVPRFFKRHPEILVAFAFFDMGIYKPTKIALENLLPNMVPGGVILLDELTWDESPGEAIAFKEVFNGIPYRIEKCEKYPSKTLVTILGGNK